jgi:hypothetical protein
VSGNLFARDLLRERPCLIAVLELLDEIQKLAYAELLERMRRLKP